MKSQHLRYILSLLLLLASTGLTRAFSPDTYTKSSALSRGRWVKLSVSQTGLHMISLADLRAWGFDNPSKVRIYGYGGKRISDRFTFDNYTDDLPMLQSELTSRGIVFYAEGPLTPTSDIYGTIFYTTNPYSTLGYYFISDNEAEERTIPVEGRPATGQPGQYFTETAVHETDAVSPAGSGHLMVGEDFRFTPTRRFTIQLPGREDDSEITMQCVFFAKASGGVQLTFAENGNTLPASTSDRVSGTGDWGELATMRRTFVPTSGQQLNLTVTASQMGTLTQAHLDKITVNYQRRIALPASHRLEFTGLASSLEGAGENTRIWDVTNPLAIVRMNHSVTDGIAGWNNDYYGRRTYAAWNENAQFLTPKVAGVIKNQNLHGEKTPDMVIITHSALKEQANRIAKLHTETIDTMRVLVVTPETVYNEFSSGTPDINGLRRMLKMFYDRGTDSKGHRLQYVLLMGSANYDHRKLTAAWQRNTQATIPIWQTDNGHLENYSYSTDDAYGILADNSGLNLEADMLNVAVGRIPAHTAAEAKVYVDRLIAYSTAPSGGQWRNRIMFVADDGDNNIHMSQTEDMEHLFRSQKRGREMTYSKVYVDTYDKIGGVVQVARDKFYNLLNDGTVWWNYVGHSSITTMGSEGLLGLTDINNLYLRRAPFYYGATCSFAHWDGDEYSGLEMLTLSDAGGVIGGISATRSVYITRNGILTKGLGQELFATDGNGNIRPIGEVLRRAKNGIGSDSNKLRYVLLGDPAMRLAIPSAIATLDYINDVAVVPDDGESEPLVIQALATTTLRGSVLSSDGHLLDSFNGYIDLTLYDAERSFTTQGRGNETADGYVYDEQGDQLYTGRAKVVNGKWECSFVLPADIADNFRNATLAMYAQTDDASLSAGGANRNFYVYGYDENSITDDKAPVIESMYLNHETFASGDPVNVTPLLLARVSDDMGLNMSLAGIGHQMSLRIDDNIHLSDLSSSFIPDSDGMPAGDIVYQLPELTAGVHRATLKVWDIGGNSATASIDFIVDPTLAPKIFDVYTDANPATVEANFYIAHNRPDAMLTVRIDIYDLSGQPIWSATERGRADMFLSSPVNWNLTNSAGARVGRDIYVYRATVTTEATSDAPATSSSVAKRIAVAPF